MLTVSVSRSVGSEGRDNGLDTIEQFIHSRYFVRRYSTKHTLDELTDDSWDTLQCIFGFLA